MATDTIATAESGILSGPAPDHTTTRTIDFNRTEVPEYEDYFAMVIEDLLTPKECTDLLSLVRPPDNAPWPTVTVTTFDGHQVVDLSSRNCGRVIHKSRFLADRILDRLLPHLPPEIVTLDDAPDITGQYPVLRREKWKISHSGEDLRFLKYEAGEYFKAHCDGHFEDEGKREKSYLAVHLYLNGGDGEVVEGGATRFAVDYEDPCAGKVDVNPKAGSAVVFQQRDMYHEGAVVTKGTKYTMRTDAVYRKIWRHG